MEEPTPTEKASGKPAPTKRFTLDTIIEDEGLNLSQFDCFYPLIVLTQAGVGERSLVSLARALVKDVSTCLTVEEELRTDST